MKATSLSLLFCLFFISGCGIAALNDGRVDGVHDFYFGLAFPSDVSSYITTLGEAGRKDELLDFRNQELRKLGGNQPPEERAKTLENITLCDSILSRADQPVQGWLHNLSSWEFIVRIHQGDKLISTLPVPPGRIPFFLTPGNYQISWERSSDGRTKTFSRTVVPGQSWESWIRPI